MVGSRGFRASGRGHKETPRSRAHTKTSSPTAISSREMQGRQLVPAKSTAQLTLRRWPKNLPAVRSISRSDGKNTTKASRSGRVLKKLATSMTLPTSPDRQAVAFAHHLVLLASDLDLDTSVMLVEDVLPWRDGNGQRLAGAQQVPRAHHGHNADVIVVFAVPRQRNAGGCHLLLLLNLEHHVVERWPEVVNGHLAALVTTNNLVTLNEHAILAIIRYFLTVQVRQQAEVALFHGDRHDLPGEPVPERLRGADLECVGFGHEGLKQGQRGLRL